VVFRTFMWFSLGSHPWTLQRRIKA
jgi:hypothetical protein